jgi:hypothetical protein
MMISRTRSRRSYVCFSRFTIPNEYATTTGSVNVGGISSRPRPHIEKRHDPVTAISSLCLDRIIHPLTNSDNSDDAMSVVVHKLDSAQRWYRRVVLLCSLERLCEEISNHLPHRTVFNPYLLAGNPVRDKEIANVNVAHSLAAGPETIAARNGKTHVNKKCQMSGPPPHMFKTTTNTADCPMFSVLLVD